MYICAYYCLLFVVYENVPTLDSDIVVATAVYDVLRVICAYYVRWGFMYPRSVFGDLGLLYYCCKVWYEYDHYL